MTSMHLPVIEVPERLAMFNRYNLEEIRARARAAFIGMAIGDALGATVEFMTAAEIAAKYRTFRDIVGGGWLRLKPGQVTDDTEMAICGMLAGAYFGMEGIPQRWIRRMDAALIAEIDGLVERLIAASPAGRMN